MVYMTIRGLDGSKARLEYRKYVFQRLKTFIFVYKSLIIEKIIIVIKYYFQ